jgi:chemotaxis protein CheX
MDQISNASRERVQIHLGVRAAGLGAAAAPTSGARSSTRLGWREVLANAASEVFEIMVGSSLEPAAEGDSHVLADFTAMVGIAGTVCGVFGFRASAESAKRMAALMLGVDEVGATENVPDAFGEICNMIAGSFKSKIARLADGCALSVPTVISGRDYALYSLANGERFEVTLSFEGHPISVTLDLHM